MASKKKYSKEMLLNFYRTMNRMRSFEERAAECFTKGMLAGNIHLSIGQEAAEAGAFAAIQEKDFFTSTHRGHGHVIARGGDAKRAMAELFGKKTGYCKGKGGSMHIADMAKMNHLAQTASLAQVRLSPQVPHSHPRSSATTSLPLAASATALPTRVPSTSPLTWLLPGSFLWYGSSRTTATAFPPRSTE